MKKLVIGLLIIAMIIPTLSMAEEGEGITVKLNSEIIIFDVEPQIINGRTMVPMRKIFESLGAVVTWDDASKTATGKKDDIVVNITLNSNVLFKNGNPLVLDTQAVIVDGRTLVPVRAIAESFDCKVDWDGDTRTVNISADIAEEKSVLTAAEIVEKDSAAVFYIEVYNSSGEATASGSGFFIAPDGTAVTNYHVIEGTSSAHIMTIGGKTYKIENIVKYDEKMDIAVIKVSKKDEEGNEISAFPFLNLGNSNNIKAGQIVYALGSPKGLQNTISDGIISNVRQKVGEETYIQITAAISHGSSGGALVDQYGDVIGITSAGITDAENIGFAIPINEINSIDMEDDNISYEDFSKLTQSVTLEISEEEITIEVGESETLYVYAAGAEDEDWSIYWDSEDEGIADCEWGDWLDDYPDICPLYIYGEGVGETYICVTSDAKSEPRYCKVTVTEPKVEFYPETITPTYTYYSGIEPIEVEEKIYTYPLDESIVSYMKWLLELDYIIYKEEEEAYGYSFILIDEYDSYIGITVALDYGEVWIYPIR